MTDKPDLTRIWAETADPTDIVDPNIDEAGKFSLGWLAEIPPHTWFNFLQNFITEGLAHFNEFGIAQWDSATAYPEGGWARSTVDDEVYVSLVVSNQNNEPSVSAAQWDSLKNVLGTTYANQTEVDTGTESAKAIAPDTFKGNLDNRGLWDYAGVRYGWDFTDSDKSGVYASGTPTNSPPPFGSSTIWMAEFIKRNASSFMQLAVSDVGVGACRGYQSGWGKWKLLTPLVMHVRDEKPSGTAGGSSVVGSQVRTLNTVVKNEINGASLTSNQVTLPAGVYNITARAQVFRGASHKIRLYNVTDGSVEVVGSSARSNQVEHGGSDSFIAGERVSISTPKAFRLDHYIGYAKSTDGLGIATNSGDAEHYAEVIITQIAEA